MNADHLIRIRVGCALLALSIASPVLAQHANKHNDRALAEDPRLAPGQIAPRLDGLGPIHMEISTDDEAVQAFFDQGMALTYGFNHQEALRAFKEAARLDPECAMAYWGWALVLSPNLNLPMQADVVPQAWEAITNAVKYKDKVSQKERMLIEALAKRLTDDPEADRKPFDQAYAEAMLAVYEEYPEDNDVATLYAASLMNLSPWNYWTDDGRPREKTPAVLSALEGAIERDNTHTGALHYYIHAVEAAEPDRGTASADLLRGLAPGAGHLVHMPSHIYMQVGRYEEAFVANDLAAAADEGYITQCQAQGIYPLAYYPHNIHFKAWAAMTQGRRADAMESSRKVLGRVQEAVGDGDHWWMGYETFLTMPLFTMIRFGMWDEALAEPAPPAGAHFWTGVWHYARGSAYLSQGNAKKAKKELKAIRKLAGAPMSKEMRVGFAKAETLLTIAGDLLAGEIASAAGDHTEAIGYLSGALFLQESIRYNEPPDWPIPARQLLGAALIEAGRYAEAEAVYWRDLEKLAENGFSLFGLVQSLQSQGRDDDVAAVQTRLEAAWASADVELQSSRY